jgi:hypothetical protein
VNTGKVYTVEGNNFTIDADNLAELQAAVGGYVEAVYTGGGTVLYVNEDGISLGLVRNPWVPSLRGNIVEVVL